MADRSSIYAAIEGERRRQDEAWPRDLVANPNRAQYKFNAPHILLLEEKIARLRSVWYSSERKDIQAEYLKIAAIAVRALEEVE